MSFLPPYQQLLQHSNLRFSKDIYQKAYYSFRPKELYVVDSEYPVYSSNSNDGNADLTNLNQNNISDSIPNKVQVSTKGIFGNNFQQFTYNNTYNRDYLTDNRLNEYYISINPGPTTLSTDTYNVDQRDTIPKQNNDNEEDFLRPSSDKQPNDVYKESTRDSGVGTSTGPETTRDSGVGTSTGPETTRDSGVGTSTGKETTSVIKLPKTTDKKNENISLIQNHIIKQKNIPINTVFDLGGDKYVYTGFHNNKKPKVVVKGKP